MIQIFKLTPLKGYYNKALWNIPGLEHARQGEYDMLDLQVGWSDNIEKNVDLWKKITESISRRCGATTKTKKCFGLLPGKEESDVFKLNVADFNQTFIVMGPVREILIPVLESRKQFLEEMVCSEDELNIYRQLTSIWVPITRKVNHYEEYTDPLSGLTRMADKNQFVFARWAHL